MTVVRIALVLIGMLVVIHGGQQPSLLGFVEGLIGTAISVVGLSGVGLVSAKAQPVAGGKKVQEHHA